MKALIHSKMTAILAEFPAVTKSQSGQGISYTYRGIDDALLALNPLLAKHRVYLQPLYSGVEWSERGTSRSGAVQYHVLVKGTLSFVAEDGSSFAVSLLGEGVDSRDKCIMKAQANALKYAIWYTFCVPTAEVKDSEAYDAEDSEVVPYVPIDRVSSAFQGAETVQGLEQVAAQFSGKISPDDKALAGREYKARLKELSS